MQLGQPETFGVLDDHDVASGTSTPTSITVVATRMPGAPSAKAAMAASFSAPFIRPCTSPTLSPKPLAGGIAFLGGGEVDGLALLDQRTDPIDARAVASARPSRVDHLVEPIERQRAGVDRLAARRLLVETGDIHVAVGGQHQRARNRRRGHDQQVGARRPCDSASALMHAEAVLLVDDGEAEIAELDLVLKQRVGADDEIDLAVGQRRRASARASGRVAAGEERELTPAAAASGAMVA